MYATEPLDNSNGEVVIPNSVTSHITRNWRDGQGLYDDAHDNVITRVIDTFGFASSYHGFSTARQATVARSPRRRPRPGLEGVAMLLAAVAAVLLGIWATSAKKGRGMRRALAEHAEDCSATCWTTPTTCGGSSSAGRSS